MDISILQDRNRQITVCGPILSGPNTAHRLLICTSSHPYPPPKTVFVVVVVVLRRKEDREKGRRKNMQLRFYVADSA